MKKAIRLSYPWDRKDWPAVSQLLLSPVQSVFEFDSRIQKRVGSNPRSVTELFKKCGYEADETTRELINSIIASAKGAQAALKRYETALAGPGNVEFTRKQVRSIVAGIFIGLFERPLITKQELKMAGLSADDVPIVSFEPMWKTQSELFLKCMLTYFIVTGPASVIPAIAQSDAQPPAHVSTHFPAEHATSAHTYYSQFMKQRVVFSRSHTQPPDWRACDAPLTTVAFGEGNLDDSPVNYQVVSCKRVLCDNLLSSSPTAEEIAMMIRPECFAALVFCPALFSDVICVVGTIKFSLYAGIGSSSKWVGPCRDYVTSGDVNQHAIVFMDAGPGTASTSQFTGSFPRDLAKACSGFCAINGPADAAATHWIYAHNPYDAGLRLVQQIAAASVAGKNLVYHVHAQIAAELERFICTINDIDISVTRFLEIYYEAYEAEYHENRGVRLADNEILARMIEIINGADDE